MRRAKSSSQAGFSLVETVAAMGILAMAALPLMQVASDATRNTAHLETRLLARTVAENVMARTMALPETGDAGLSRGREVQMGRDFVWSLTTGPGRAGELQALEVLVQVEGDVQVLARLVSLKAVPLVIAAPIEVVR